MSVREQPEALTREQGRRRRLLNVELVGPAGAGKTSVLREIGRRDGSIQLWQRFDRGLRHLPAISRDAIALAPAAIQLLYHQPRSSRLCIQHLLRLRRFRTILAGAATPPSRARLLGEGPVYSLCRLQLAQDALPVTTVLPRAWRATLAQWPGDLDVIVSLDAPDAVLANRIRLRSKSHEIKDRHDADVYAFLQRYRDAYRDILARLSALGRVRVVAIDTAEESIEGIATRILGVIEDLRPRARPGEDQRSPTACCAE